MPNPNKIYETLNTRISHCFLVRKTNVRKCRVFGKKIFETSNSGTKISQQLEGFKIACVQYNNLEIPRSKPR